MKRYFYSIIALSISATIHGAACSSEQAAQGRICFSDLPHPIHVYESHHDSRRRVDHSCITDDNDVNEAIHGSCSQRNAIFRSGRGLCVSGRVISEDALQNPRRKKGFPTKFTLRYRNADGTWHCGDHYVLPQTFMYREPDKELVRQNLRLMYQRDEESQQTCVAAFVQAIHDAPLKRFPAIEDESLFRRLLPRIQESSIPQDISMYLELNRFDGPLLYTVGDYFRCFPKIGYLSLKRYMDPLSEGTFFCEVVYPAVTFARVQEGRESGELVATRQGEEMERRCAEFTGGIDRHTMPILPIGDIPAWPAQCMRSKKSLAFLECLKSSIHTPAERVIDLRNHTIDPHEIRAVVGEGNLFILSTEDGIDRYHRLPSVYAQITQAQVNEINEHFAQQCSLKRRFLDTLYNWRYYVAAGAAAAVVGTYMYRQYAALVAERAKEIAQVTEQLDAQKNAYRLLKDIIDSAKDKQGVAQMSADEMCAVLNAHIDIKTVGKEWDRLAELMPSSWTPVHSLFAAIKNKIGTITGIGVGTYVADFCAKYFLGYRPYMPSRIEVMNHFHDYYADKIPYSEVCIQPGDGGRDIQRGYCCGPSSSACDIETFWQHRPRKFDDILPHYDEAAETAFKRNQSLAILGASIGIPLAAFRLYLSKIKQGTL